MKLKKSIITVAVLVILSITPTAMAAPHWGEGHAHRHHQIAHSFCWRAFETGVRPHMERILNEREQNAQQPVPQEQPEPHCDGTGEYCQITGHPHDESCESYRNNLPQQEDTQQQQQEAAPKATPAPAKQQHHNNNNKRRTHHNNGHHNKGGHHNKSGHH